MVDDLYELKALQEAVRSCHCEGRDGSPKKIYLEREYADKKAQQHDHKVDSYRCPTSGLWHLTSKEH